MNKNFTLLKFNWLFIAFFLFLSACKDVVQIEKTPPLDNKQITLSGGLNFAYYGPIFKTLLDEIKENYEFFYPGKDDYNTWRAKADNLINSNWYLSTGLTSEGKEVGVRKLNNAHWEKAVSILKEITKDLKDKHFGILELFEKFVPRDRTSNHRLSLLFFNEKKSVFGDLTEIKKGSYVDFFRSTASYFTGVFSRDKILYLHFSGFLVNTIGADPFKEFQEKAIKEGYEKIILDFRSNGGGNAYGGSKFISLFFDKKNPVYTCFNTRVSGDPSVPKTNWRHKDRVNSAYTKEKIPEDRQIVILVDQNTASMAEHATMALRKRRNVIVVGEQTMGAFSPIYPSAFSVPFGGGTYELKNPHTNKLVLKWRKGRGAHRTMRDEVEGEGLKPDVEVDFLKGGSGMGGAQGVSSWEGTVFSSATDPQLEKARELLRNNEPLKNAFYTGNTSCPTRS